MVRKCFISMISEIQWLEIVLNVWFQSFLGRLNGSKCVLRIHAYINLFHKHFFYFMNTHGYLISKACSAEIFSRIQIREQWYGNNDDPNLWINFSSTRIDFLKFCLKLEKFQKIPDVTWKMLSTIDHKFSFTRIIPSQYRITLS